MPRSKSVSIKLNDIAHGGDAVGKYDGMVVFVPYGIPGDVVNVEVIGNKKRFGRGVITRIEESSVDRIKPRCDYFERCGGCHWQHINYSTQLKFKQQIVRDTLTRIGSFNSPPVHPTISNPHPWKYRSHLTFNRNHSGKLGLVSTDNRNIISIDECSIARPEIVERLNQLNETPNPRAAQRVRIQVGINNQAADFSMDEDDSASKSFTETTYYSVLDRAFQCSPGSFFQADPDQAAVLVQLVLDSLNLQGTEQVLDLFSGVGLFTAFIAKQALQVIGVEISESATRDAEANLSDFSNVNLIQAGIKEALESDVIPPSLSVDAIVVDPPRTGVRPEDLDAILTMSPLKIVYVSCDPATFARDAKQIVAAGYSLISVQPVDMFPQTYHIEAVSTFVKHK